MLRATNLAEAQSIWKNFHEKYANLTPLIKENRDVYNKKLSEEEIIKFAEKIDEKMIKATRVLQKMWRRKREKDTLVSVNKNGNHNSEFLFLIANESVKRSLNKEKCDLLLAAIHEANWEAAIFQDAFLPEIALSLFAAEKISQQQIYTILERAQTAKNYPILSTFRIFDKQGEFTEEAKDIFFSALASTKYLRKLNQQQTNKFKYLIQALPLSEQVFYMTERGSLKQDYPYDAYYHNFYTIDGLLANKDMTIHLTCGLRDALGLVRFNDNYFRTMPRFGKHPKEGIEKGTYKKIRYAALWYPGTIPYDDIHGHENVTGLVALAHDVVHAYSLSVIPPQMHQAFDRLITIVRHYTGYPWTREIWEYVDREFLFLFHHNKSLQATFERLLDENGIKQNQANIAIILNTILFSETLMHGSLQTAESPLTGGFITKIQKSSVKDLKKTIKIKEAKWDITLIGIQVYLDMLANKEDWLKIKIDPEYLTYPLKEHYTLIKTIYADIKNDSNKIQQFKSFLYVKLTLSQQENSFPLFCQLINKNNEKIEKQLAFKKITKKMSEINPERIVNTVYLSYKRKNVESMNLQDWILAFTTDLETKPYENEPITNLFITQQANAFFSARIRELKQHRYNQDYFYTSHALQNP